MVVLQSAQKKQIEQLMTNQNHEKSRLLEEIAQLRNRLIKKAETIGEYEFQASRKVQVRQVETHLISSSGIICEG